jgi:hypothetical protein
LVDSFQVTGGLDIRPGTPVFQPKTLEKPGSLVKNSASASPGGAIDFKWSFVSALAKNN